MWNWRLLCCFFGCLLIYSAAAQPQAHIPILALDGTGNPAAGVAKDGLIVRFAGKPVEVEEIRPLKDEPLIFSMIVDESASTRLSAKQQTAVAIQLFRALSTGSNHGYLVLFNENANASDHFLDAETAEQALMRASPKGSTALYDAIIAACRQQLNSTSSPGGSRRAIFVFSDGGDNTSRHSLYQTVEIVQREEIPIFSTKIGVGTESARVQKEELKTLKTLSGDTGGLVILPDEHRDVVEYLQKILESQSVLTFKTAELKPKKENSLKIEAGAKDVHVLAQTEYFAR